MAMDGRNNPPSPQLSSPASIALWNFSSQWFLIPQGSGILAIILHQLDYQFRGLEIISEVVWVYTIVLLALTVLIYLIRIIKYPRHVAKLLRSRVPEVSGLASISITFTTIIQMIALTITRDWGSSWGLVAFILWWINTAMAVIAVIGIPYIAIQLQSPNIECLTPSLLLPLIATLTSAAGGGVICQYGEINHRLQVPIIIVSYLEMSVGLLLAVVLDGIFLAQSSSRPREVDRYYQDMILCGPFGQGSFALQILGQAVGSGSFAQYARGTFLTAEAAAPVAFASQFLGLLLWGYGTFWWCFAVVRIIHALLAQPGGLRTSSFTMSAWALVFPWGVYTNAAVQLGKIMDAPAFKVWSTVLLLVLLIIWIANHIFTIKGLITGRILGLEHGWKFGRYGLQDDEKHV
ncbi:voltage-dependent anion channel [Aspergillus avenaceus]|uniref:Sulfite efflux pump SSU1 n=1 Tax=Aspergillus avenaceus TaxID=36643 RepID=A0A5N6TJP1_ASPAV|nr:voltage-dependent anion channel [Aspergillus avenaceus]